MHICTVNENSGKWRISMSRADFAKADTASPLFCVFIWVYTGPHKKTGPEGTQKCLNLTQTNVIRELASIFLR